MKVYKSETPPAIDLSSILKVPIVLFVGKEDSIANPVDTRVIKDTIQSIKKYVELDNFDHGSFMLAKDMSYLNQVLEELKQYNGDKLGRECHGAEYQVPL